MPVAVWVYVGLALASLVSLILRRPWTIPLARRHAPPAVWSTDLFLETNLAITAIWTMLFGGGAVVAAVAPVWGRLAYGVGLGALGRLTPHVGRWYSGRRRRAMESPG